MLKRCEANLIVLHNQTYHLIIINLWIKNSEINIQIEQKANSTYAQPSITFDSQITNMESKILWIADTLSFPKQSSSLHSKNPSSSDYQNTTNYNFCHFI